MFISGGCTSGNSPVALGSVAFAVSDLGIPKGPVRVSIWNQGPKDHIWFLGRNPTMALQLCPLGTEEAASERELPRREMHEQPESFLNLEREKPTRRITPLREVLARYRNCQYPNRYLTIKKLWLKDHVYCYGFGA